MISRFFEGTKPITYLVLLIFLLGFFVFKFYVQWFTDQIGYEVSTNILAFVFLALQIYFVNEIARKANLTEMSSFPMLFFILLITAFSEVLFDVRLIISNFFVVLSIQDLLTINTSKRSNLNFFSSTLWLCVASLFFPPVVFLFLPVVFAVIFYGASDIRNWLMPLAAILCFLLIGYATALLIDATSFFAEHYKIVLPENLFSEFNFENYTRLTFYSIANIVLLVIVFGRLQDIGKGRVLEIRMLFLFFIVGILLTLISLGPKVGLRAILFTFCPVSIFITNYFQIFRRKRLREYVLLFIIVAPISISIWKLFG